VRIHSPSTYPSAAVKVMVKVNPMICLSRHRGEVKIQILLSHRQALDEADPTERNKVKIILEKSTKVQRRSTGVALLFL
jgi:hypothetical protein